MFIQDDKILCSLEWMDLYGNKRFRYGSGNNDVVWLSGADQIKEKYLLGTSGTLTKSDGKWIFEPSKKKQPSHNKTSRFR
jgi:hypothetical protein